MKNVVLFAAVLLGSILAGQGCSKGSGSSSVPAAQYYASQVVASPSQGKPLSTCLTNPSSVPIVTCRTQDKDAYDQMLCQNAKNHPGKGDPNKGIVICVVPQNGGTPTTYCLSLQGVLSHFDDTGSYLGVCSGAPTSTPVPSPTPLPPFG